MLTCEYNLEPPCDHFEEIEAIMNQAFEYFLLKGYNNKFKDIYDLVHEAIVNDLEKYQGEPDYAYLD